MQADYHQQQGRRLDTTLDPQSFKDVERFSREVCQHLAKKRGAHYTEAPVQYGLATFLVAVVQAVKGQALKKALQP